MGTSDEQLIRKNKAIHLNSEDLEREMDWFFRVLDVRFRLYFQQETEYATIEEVLPPNIDTSPSLYANTIRKLGLDAWERLAIMLAFLPHIRPEGLDVFFITNSQYDRGFTEFGGILGKQHGGFIPTGETLVFLLAENDLEKRIRVLSLFSRNHLFATHNLLTLNLPEKNEPLLSGTLSLAPEYLSLFTTGDPYQPKFSHTFPAQHIETRLDWKDLVLHEGTLAMVREIESWMKFSGTLLKDWQMESKIRPGYRALFHGPPGTGKTMTACLLGKSTGYEVYRVDLSAVISKYIGETEKNLARVFEMAEHKQWILFFDEADALFGKRSQTKDAHDRYANQEVAYLLQRIETFNGIAILASNLKENLDKAFARRFESLIYFPMPGPQERLKLWKQGISPKASLEPQVDLKKVAREYEIPGGSIMNVIRFVSMRALERGDGIIHLQDILKGIKREFTKEGRRI